MKFFRGYALIRWGTMAKKTPCLKGVHLLGGGTISGFNFVGGNTSFDAKKLPIKPHISMLTVKFIKNMCHLGCIDMVGMYKW